MTYVDGFVFVVKKNKLKAYKKMASEAGKIWKKYGALEYLECMGDDMKSVEKWNGLAFPKMTKAKPGEVVFFSFIVYQSKKHRNQVNAKVMKDPVLNDPKNKDMPMPFDIKKMAYGGFKTVVEERN